MCPGLNESRALLWVTDLDLKIIFAICEQSSTFPTCKLSILERQLNCVTEGLTLSLYRHCSPGNVLLIFMEDLGKAARRLCSDAVFTSRPGVWSQRRATCFVPLRGTSWKGCLSRVTDAGHWVGVCPGVQLLRPTWVRDNTQAGLHQEWSGDIFTFDFSFLSLLKAHLEMPQHYWLVLRFLECFLTFLAV